MSQRIRLLVLAAGLAVIGILVTRIGARVLFDLVARIGWNLLTMLLLYASHVALRGVALWLATPNRSVPLSDVMRVRLSAEAVEVLTYTGPFLAEPAKGWLLTKHGLSATEAFAAVATEYLLYSTVSAVLALVGFGMLATEGTLGPSMHTAATLVAVAMALFTAAVAFAAVTGIGLIAPMLRGGGGWLGLTRLTEAATAFEPVERMLVGFLHTQPTALALVIATEMIGHGLLIAEIYVALSALGVHFSAQIPVVIEGGAKIIGVVFFFIPGQLGASEGVYAALARAVALPASIGLTLALVRRLRSVVVATAGLVMLSFDRKTES